MNIHDIAKQIRSFADELEATKPEQPKPFTLPTPPPGMHWHREDGWKEGDLPPGTRPLCDGEPCEQGDEVILPSHLANRWSSVGLDFGAQMTPRHLHTRTTRPLLFTHSGREWVWHRAGDPMPCDGKCVVVTLLEDLSIGGTIRAGRFDWGKRDDGEQILGWRYADAETEVDRALALQPASARASASAAAAATMSVLRPALMTRWMFMFMCGPPRPWRPVQVVKL